MPKNPALPLTKEGIQQLFIEKTNYLTKRGYAIFKDQYGNKKS